MTMILSKSGGNKYNKVATVWAGTSWLASTAVHSSQWYYLLIFQSSTPLNQLNQTKPNELSYGIW